MKHIEIYELFGFGKKKKTSNEIKPNKYKANDYVIYYEVEDFDHLDPDSEVSIKEYPVKILDTLAGETSYYQVEYPDGTRTVIDDDDISRFLTPEEIEEFDYQKNINKYNL